MTSNAPRRAVIAAALAAAAAAATTATAQSASAEPSGAAAPGALPSRHGRDGEPDSAPVDYHGWTSFADWLFGAHAGTRPVAGPRPGLEIGRATGTLDYTDPHTGITATWESASWTSPVRRVPHPASELISSWNAHTPAGTWIQVELLGTYTDGTATPAYVMGRWTAGDGDEDIRRTSVDDQTDGKSSIWTDTFSIDDAAAGPLLASYRLRLTLFRKPGSRLTPTRVAARRDGVEHPGPLHRAGLGARRGRGRGAAGARVLAEHPQGAVPGVRQRRRGLVQPDVVHDGHRVLGPRPDRAAAVLGRPVVRGPAGRPGRPLHLRLPVRGLRQLAVQRGLRGHVQGPAGRHHPAALARATWSG